MHQPAMTCARASSRARSGPLLLQYAHVGLARPRRPDGGVGVEAWGPPVGRFCVARLVSRGNPA
eukprot:5071631-Pyramimonas_sp.AAC.1